MDLWYPPNDEPQLLDWWRPLLLAGQAARQARICWPIHLDEFMLMGRVERAGRPDVWVYKHHASRRELYIDDRGRTYRYTTTPNAKAHGRFNECDIRTAVWRAELPAFVEPVWFDEPRSWGSGEPPPEPDEQAGGRRHGHLTLYQGGGSLAG